VSPLQQCDVLIGIQKVQEDGMDLSQFFSVCGVEVRRGLQKNDRVILPRSNQLL